MNDSEAATTSNNCNVWYLGVDQLIQGAEIKVETKEGHSYSFLVLRAWDARHMRLPEVRVTSSSNENVPERSSGFTKGMFIDGNSLILISDQGRISDGNTINIGTISKISVSEHNPTSPIWNQLQHAVADAADQITFWPIAESMRPPQLPELNSSHWQHFLSWKFFQLFSSSVTLDPRKQTLSISEEELELLRQWTLFLNAHISYIPQHTEIKKFTLSWPALEEVNINLYFDLLTGLLYHVETKVWPRKLANAIVGPEASPPPGPPGPDGGESVPDVIA